MVKITGRMGKSSGSPAGPQDFEQEIYMSVPEVAAMLRELAAEIETGGRVEASSEAWNLGVNPLPPIKVELEYKFGKKELEIQVKLKEFP